MPMQVTPKSAKKSKWEELFLQRTYIHAVGRRKEATAQVRLYTDGKARIYVNEKEYRKYFPYFEYQKIITKPLDLLKEKQKFDVSVMVQGGGIHAQAGAIALGISRGLVKCNQEYKEKLRANGLLTRDPRVKERKKPGLKRARRAPQWAKR